MLGLKNKVSCPYCYYEIELSGVKLRCTGRPAPGRPRCEPREDSVRFQQFGDATPVLPSFTPERQQRGGVRRAECPHCSGPTGLRVCQYCHSVLPAGFGTGSPIFGVVGVKNSGKTVMLSVLTRELTTTVARRFDASIDVVGTSKLMDKLRAFRDAMDESRKLPGSTEQYRPDETVPAVLEWTYKREYLPGISRHVSTILSFYDTAGEDVADIESAQSQHYLAAADGLILILDPFGFPKNRERAIRRGVDPESLATTPSDVLRAITEMLRSTEGTKPNQLIKRNLAVVLGKIDAFFDVVGPDHPIRKPSPSGPFFDEAESVNLHGHIESLIASWGGDDVLALLRHNYKNYRFFAASALGAEPNYAQQALADERGVRPHRVSEPLLWLMSARGFVERNT